MDDGFGFVRVPKGGEPRPDGPIGSGGLTFLGGNGWNKLEENGVKTCINFEKQYLYIYIEYPFLHNRLVEKEIRKAIQLIVIHIPEI